VIFKENNISDKFASQDNPAIKIFFLDNDSIGNNSTLTGRLRNSLK
jgi:hypothetical protein